MSAIDSIDCAVPLREIPAPKQEDAKPKAPSNAQRQKDFRARHGEQYKARHKAYMKAYRARKRAV